MKRPAPAGDCPAGRPPGRAQEGTGRDGRSSAPPRPEELAALVPRLLAVAQRLTRDAGTAEDVVHNAFVKALRHLPAFRGQAQLSTWMHRIAVNEALMWLRAEQRYRSRCAEAASARVAPVAPPTRPDDAVAAAEEVARLEGAIRALSAPERDVVEACVLGGEPYRSYAARAGVHPAAARSRAFRARRRLTALLRSEADAPIPPG